MADGETRKLRRKLHQEFDPLWRGRAAKMGRVTAYGMLADRMKINRDDCHISRFTYDQCVQALRICKILRSGKSTSAYYFNNAT